MMPLRRQDRRTKQLIWALAALAVLLNFPPGFAERKPPASLALGKGVWLNDFLAGVRVRGGFSYTLEDISGSGNTPYSGLYSFRLPLPRRTVRLRDIIAEIRSKLPSVKAWRDAHNPRAIHVALAGAAKWRSNPLDAIVTINGTKSFAEIAASITKQVGRGRIKFLYSPPIHGAVPIGYAPPAPPKKRFKVRIERRSVQHVLTDSLRYSGNGGNRLLWVETVYTGHGGKFQRQVVVTVSQVPAGVRR